MFYQDQHILPCLNVCLFRSKEMLYVDLLTCRIPCVSVCHREVEPRVRTSEVWFFFLFFYTQLEARANGVRTAALIKVICECICRTESVQYEPPESCWLLCTVSVMKGFQGLVLIPPSSALSTWIWMQSPRQYFCSGECAWTCIYRLPHINQAIAAAVFQYCHAAISEVIDTCACSLPSVLLNMSNWQVRNEPDVSLDVLDDWKTFLFMFSISYDRKIQCLVNNVFANMQCQGGFALYCMVPPGNRLSGRLLCP